MREEGDLLEKGTLLKILTSTKWGGGVIKGGLKRTFVINIQGKKPKYTTSRILYMYVGQNCHNADIATKGRM